MREEEILKFLCAVVINANLSANFLKKLLSVIWTVTYYSNDTFPTWIVMRDTMWIVTHE